VVAAACVLKILVFRAHWPLQIKAVDFLETAGRVELFLSLFIYVFFLSPTILFLSTFRYIILSLFLLPFTSNVFFVFCFIYLFHFHSRFCIFPSYIFFIPLLLLYSFFFFNIIFLIEFCRAARDLKRCSTFSWLYLHYIVRECTQFMWCLSPRINSRFQLILNHSPLNVSSTNSKKW
jgi:hypothetical protein